MMKMTGLLRRRLLVNRPRRWLDSRLRKRRERGLLPIRRSLRLPLKRRKSRKKWLEEGKRKRTTVGDRRQRLQNKDS